jgi:hypothetical protein
MTFGSAERVSLTEARNAAARASGFVKAGIDPLAERRTGQKAERLQAASEAAQRVDFATAVDFATGQPGKPFDLCEAALGHAVGSPVRRAYARSDLLEQRRALMAEWAAFLTQPPATGRGAAVQGGGLMQRPPRERQTRQMLVATGVSLQSPGKRYQRVCSAVVSPVW